MVEALKAALRDVLVGPPTPFDDGGRTIRHDELAGTIEWLIDEGVGTLLAPGNVGEWYALSAAERAAVAETAVEAADGDATVFAGVGGSLPAARSLLAEYERLGVDGAVIMYPPHAFVHERGLVEYYRRLLETTDLGLVLYKRGPVLTTDVIAALADIGNLVGVKYAVEDVAGFAAARERYPDLAWTCGIAERYATAFAAEGADGFTSGIASVLPRASLALRDALQAEDWARARDLAGLLRPLEALRAAPGAGNSIAGANNVPVLKHGLEVRGRYGGPVRPPLVGLDVDDQTAVAEAIDRVLAAEY